MECYLLSFHRVSYYRASFLLVSTPLPHVSPPYLYHTGC